jgi:hypothetical protein
MSCVGGGWSVAGQAANRIAGEPCAVFGYVTPGQIISAVGTSVPWCVWMRQRIVAVRILFTRAPERR